MELFRILFELCSSDPKCDILVQLSADKAMDTLSRPLHDWAVLEKACALRPWVKYVQR